MDRRTDLDRDLVGARRSPSCLLQFEQSVNTHGDDGNTQVFYQQTDPRTEGLKFAVNCVVSFGKHEHTETAVHGLSREGKAVAKAGFTRKGKDIEERYTQEPFSAIEDSQEKIAASGWGAQGFEGFASSR